MVTDKAENRAFAVQEVVTEVTGRTTETSSAPETVAAAPVMAAPAAPLEVSLVFADLPESAEAGPDVEATPDVEAVAVAAAVEPTVEVTAKPPVGEPAAERPDVEPVTEAVVAPPAAEAVAEPVAVAAPVAALSPVPEEPEAAVLTQMAPVGVVRTRSEVARALTVANGVQTAKKQHLFEELIRFASVEPVAEPVAAEVEPPPPRVTMTRQAVFDVLVGRSFGGVDGADPEAESAATAPEETAEVEPPVTEPEETAAAESAATETDAEPEAAAPETVALLEPEYWGAPPVVAPAPLPEEPLFAPPVAVRRAADLAGAAPLIRPVGPLPPTPVLRYVPLTAPRARATAERAAALEMSNAWTDQRHREYDGDDAAPEEEAPSVASVAAASKPVVVAAPPVVEKPRLAEEPRIVEEPSPQEAAPRIVEESAPDEASSEPERFEALPEGHEAPFEAAAEEEDVDGFDDDALWAFPDADDEAEEGADAFGTVTPELVAQIARRVVEESNLPAVAGGENIFVPVEGLGLGIANLLGDAVGTVVRTGRKGVGTLTGIGRRRPAESHVAREAMRLPPLEAPVRARVQALALPPGPTPFESSALMGGRVVHGAQGIVSGTGSILVGGRDIVVGAVGCVTGAVGCVTDAVFSVGGLLADTGRADRVRLVPAEEETPRQEGGRP